MTTHDPQPNSPNWGWQQLGYTIERSGRTGLIRTIKDTAGNVVLHSAGYEGECAWLRMRGIIKDCDAAILSCAGS